MQGFNVGGEGVQKIPAHAPRLALVESEPAQQVGLREVENPQSHVLGPALRRIRRRALCQSENLALPSRTSCSVSRRTAPCQPGDSISASLRVWHVRSSAKAVMLTKTSDENATIPTLASTKTGSRTVTECCPKSMLVRLAHRATAELRSENWSSPYQPDAERKPQSCSSLRSSVQQRQETNNKSHYGRTEQQPEDHPRHFGKRRANAKESIALVAAHSPLPACIAEQHGQKTTCKEYEPTKRASQLHRRHVIVCGSAVGASHPGCRDLAQILP